MQKFDVKSDFKTKYKDTVKNKTLYFVTKWSTDFNSLISRWKTNKERGEGREKRKVYGRNGIMNSIKIVSLMKTINFVYILISYIPSLVYILVQYSFILHFVLVSLNFVQFSF